MNEPRRSADDGAGGTDAYTPPQMAARVATTGVAKAAMPALQTLVLGVLAGAFIAFGAMLYTLVATDAPAAWGAARLLAGLAFSLGLVLVIVGGAELFTGNNLIAMAWAARQVSTAQLLRNWLLVYLGNAVGAAGCVLLYYLSGGLGMHDQAVGVTAAGIAADKLALAPLPAFARGILCNVLVCLAVWMCFAARSVTDKVLAIVGPITAFVALGFEHSVANMYLVPIGLLAAQMPEVMFELPPAPLWAFARNLVIVTAGNIVGGSLLVALVYHLVYVRGGGRGMDAG